MRTSKSINIGRQLVVRALCVLFGVVYLEFNCTVVFFPGIRVVKSMCLYCPYWPLWFGAKLENWCHWGRHEGAFPTPQVNKHRPPLHAMHLDTKLYPNTQSLLEIQLWFGSLLFSVVYAGALAWLLCINRCLSGVCEWGDHWRSCLPCWNVSYYGRNSCHIRLEIRAKQGRTHVKSTCMPAIAVYCLCCLLLHISCPCSCCLSASQHFLIVFRAYQSLLIGSLKLKLVQPHKLHFILEQLLRQQTKEVSLVVRKEKMIDRCPVCKLLEGLLSREFPGLNWNGFVTKQVE